MSDGQHQYDAFQKQGVIQRECLGWPVATTIDLVCALARGALPRRCLTGAHRPAIDLMVDPVCQVALVLHLWGEAPEDLTQKPPDRIRDITDTGVVYVTDQPISVDSHGVHHPVVDFQVQYAGSSFVLADLYSDHSSVPGVHMPDAAVAFLGSACSTAEAVHQVAAGVGKYPYPGVAVYLMFHTMYNIANGVAPEKMNSSSDLCGW